MQTIIYYTNQLDSFGAAYAAWLKYRDVDTRYILLAPNDQVSIEHANHRLIFLGCFIELISGNFSPEVVVIDNAVATLQVAENYPSDNYAFYGDPAKGLAVLACEYFHGDCIVPLWASWLGDAGNYPPTISKTHEFVLALQRLPRILTHWHTVLDSDTELNILVKHGEGMLTLQQEIIQHIAVITSHRVMLAGEPVVIAQACWGISEILRVMLEQFPNEKIVGAYYYDSFSQAEKWILKSPPGIDAADRVATACGGSTKDGLSEFTMAVPMRDRIA